MKTIVLVLILAAFLQTTIVPVDLVLIILICRAFIKPELSNLLLAFSTGLLVGLLNLNNLGLHPLIYLLLVQIVQSLANTRLAVHLLLVIPVSLAIFGLNELILSVANQQSVELFPELIAEGLIAVPVFYSLKLWEERFVVRKEIKLKI